MPEKLVKPTPDAKPDWADNALAVVTRRQKEGHKALPHNGDATQEVFTEENEPAAPTNHTIPEDPLVVLTDNMKPSEDTTDTPDAENITEFNFDDLLLSPPSSDKQRLTRSQKQAARHEYQS